MSVILASTSHIRRELLAKAGLEFLVAKPNVDEENIKSGLANERPEHIAIALAKAKSSAIGQAAPHDIVIGADQVLSFEGEIWNKPAGVSAARQQLMMLRGKTHFLETAVACSQDGSVRWTYHECAELTMRDFSNDFLEAYLVSEGEGVCSSVGGYKLEGIGIQLFSKVRGDYFSILGLPLLPLLGFLRNAGALPT